MNITTFATNITIHFVSLFFFLFLVIVYFRKNAKNSLKNRIFHIMCYLGMIGYVLGISNLLLIKYYVNNSLIFGIQKAYYFCFFVIILLWAYYVLIITIEKNNKIANFVKNHIGEIRLLLVICIIAFGVADYYYPLKFVYDKLGQVSYVSGNIVPILAVVSAFLTLLPIISILFNHRKIIFRKLLPYSVTIILEIAVISIHNYFPELSLLCISMTILYFFIYYRLENPDIIFVRKFKRYSEKIRLIREEYSFLFNMSPELRALLNEISVEKDGLLIDKKKSVNKKKLEKLLNDFIKANCEDDSSKYDDIEVLSFDDDQSDEMLITKEIYSINELQEVLQDDNLPKW